MAEVCKLAASCDYNTNTNKFPELYGEELKRLSSTSTFYSKASKVFMNVGQGKSVPGTGFVSWIPWWVSPWSPCLSPYPSHPSFHPSFRPSPCPWSSFLSPSSASFLAEGVWASGDFHCSKCFLWFPRMKVIKQNSLVEVLK